MVDVHVSFYIPRYKKNKKALNFKSIQEHVTIWIQTVQECKKGPLWMTGAETQCEKKCMFKSIQN